MFTNLGAALKRLELLDYPISAANPASLPLVMELEPGVHSLVLEELQNRDSKVKLSEVHYETEDYDPDAKEPKLVFSTSLPGRAIRIYNSDRSAMFRIKDSRWEGGVLRVTLDATALLARGKVIEVQDGRVKLDSYMVFANSREGPDGNLLPGRYYYAGSWLGNETESFQIAGVNRSERSLVYLKQRVPEDKLKTLYQGRTISLWQYAPGDRVEIARVLEK